MQGEEMLQKTKEQKLVFRIIESALKGNTDILLPDGADWKYIYWFCRYQKIDNLAAYGIDKCRGKENIPEKVQHNFQHARQVGMAREATQHFALLELLEKFEENQIESIPLKGSQLKNCYPAADMRFLTDLDILCHREDKEQISEILSGLGYTLDHPGDIHDVYVRKPFMTVEIHWRSNENNKVLDTYFDTVWERKREMKGFCSAGWMTWEDHYIYMIGHLAKHMKFAGIGIRMLLDLYVFKEKVEYDCEYTKKVLERAGLIEFDIKMHEIIERCFEQEEPLFDEDALLRHIVENGAYGTRENSAGNRALQKGRRRIDILKTRVSIVRQIIFPNISWMKINYPYLEKMPFLLPVAWIQRIIEKGSSDPKKCGKILRGSLDKTGVKKMKEIHEKSGL